MGRKRKTYVRSLLLFDENTNAVDESQHPLGFHLKRSKLNCDSFDSADDDLSSKRDPVERTVSERELDDVKEQNSMHPGFLNETDDSFFSFPNQHLDSDCNSSSLRPTDEKLKVLIIGSGISGLAAAVALENAGAEVTVLEADGQPGGRIKSVNFPKVGKLMPVSVDIGASSLIDCSDASNTNLLYNLVQNLGLETVELSSATGWDAPLATKMITLNGKPVDYRIMARMFYLHQAIICLGMMKIIRDAGFDIPELSYNGKQNIKYAKTQEIKSTNKGRGQNKKSKRKDVKAKWKVNLKATADVPLRGVFNFSDGEIEDVMEDAFTKLSIKAVIDFGMEEYRSIRPLNLSSEETVVLNCIFTRLYGIVLPLDVQNAWDFAYNINAPLIGFNDILKQIEGPNQKHIANLVKVIKKTINDSKQAKPSAVDLVIEPEDRLICSSLSVLVNYLASKVTILYNKLCQFVHYKDNGVAVDCTDDGVSQSFDADFCIITVPPSCLKDGAEGSGLQISPQMPRAKSIATTRITMAVGEAQGLDKIILRFDKIFWDPNLTSMMNPEYQISILNYHKVGKQNVLCIQIWANSSLNMIHTSDKDLCAKCCEILKRMFPKTYKSNIKLVNWAVSRWNEDPLVRSSASGQVVGATSNDFVLYATPLPSVENPRVCFAGEATIDVLNGPIQTAHGSFSTGIREARRIASKAANLKSIPVGSELLDFIMSETEKEEVISVKKGSLDRTENEIKMSDISKFRVEIVTRNNTV